MNAHNTDPVTVPGDERQPSCCNADGSLDQELLDDHEEADRSSFAIFGSQK